MYMKPTQLKGTSKSTFFWFFFYSSPFIFQEIYLAQIPCLTYFGRANATSSVEPFYTEFFSKNYSISILFLQFLKHHSRYGYNYMW